jgi:hypothetical protein
MPASPLESAVWVDVRADATGLILWRELSRKLAKVVVLWKACNDPLLYLERHRYLGAIRDALAGVEEARVVLAKARRRLERERGQRGV